MSARTPAALDEALRQHQLLFKQEPELIMLHERFVAAYSFYFRSRLHTLCCGKGAIYSGIPAIVTASAMVSDFLVCY